ncbi:MAG TPA: sodium:solute symporter family protein [Vicinamibacteria bacterium]|nr:sodium:solute symporter family protein [Vicinamibacteria bacterium]
MTTFGLLDWLITAASLIATLAAGVAVKRYVGNLEDFLVANRGMGTYVGTASLVSTEIGIITYMYQAQFGFLAGFSAFVVGLVTILVCYCVGRTGFVITRLREMEIMTIPEFFERRYTRGVRILAGLLMAFGGSLNLGIFPIIEARFLSIVMGIDARYVGWTMVVLLLVALVYTAIGGMVSLIVTNYLQYLLLAAGTLVVTFVCLRATGWTAMTAAVTAHGNGHGFDPFGDPDIGPAFVLWQLLLWTAFITVWQSVAMRTFSTRDTQTGRKVFTLTSVLFLGRAVIPMAWGIAALAFFWARAEPLPPPSDTDQRMEIERLDRELTRDFETELSCGRLEVLLPRLERLEAVAGTAGAEEALARAKGRRAELGMVAMPWMLAAILPTGLVGLMMAGMLAASVSTYAGYFLGWSSVIAQDIVGPCLGRELSGSARLRITRVMIVALTAFILLWSLVYEVPGPAYFYLQVTANLFMAPTLITVVAGLYWKRASSAGAVLAFVLGAAASLGYLLPGIGLSVATAGNASWALATLGLWLGSLAFPDRRAASWEAA